MKTIEIENMTVQELKNRKQEIVDDLEVSASSQELCSRYVQARLDAKMRDEKLAEQGKRITELEQGAALANENVQKSLQLIERQEQLISSLNGQLSNLTIDNHSLTDQLGDASRRLNELDAENLQLKGRIADLEDVVSDYETELRIGIDESSE